jgi:hypothetical protein
VPVEFLSDEHALLAEEALKLGVKTYLAERNPA